MYGLLAGLYQSTDLPVPLMEKVFVVLLATHHTFWRENAANQLAAAITFVRKEPVDLSRPWRDMLGELFTIKAAGKAGRHKMLRKVTDEFVEHDGQEEDV